MDRLRAIAILATFLAFTGVCMPVQWLLLKTGAAAARTFPHWYHRHVARIFGIRITVIGKPVAGQGVLLVANHTSWADIVIFSAVAPDYYETFRPKLDNPNLPAVEGKDKNTYVANEKYKDVPGAMLRFGNLPAMMNASVHSGEDVILTATGPGSERVHGSMDNTEVFRVMVEALGLANGD